MSEKICCFTGHRPEKLDMPRGEIMRLLERKIIDAINEGCYTFITGMARGIDMWAAEIILNIKTLNPGIRLICASPYKGFENSWSAEDRAIYRTILKRADDVKYINHGYSRSCFQIRNMYMVDHSDMVISAYTGGRGGTRNTIDYALRKGVKIVDIFE